MTVPEAYERLAGVYDEIVVDPCHGRWAAFLDELWTVDAEGVRTVLDVCCGTGLMAAELTALGYRVTGVDASEAMLERARRLLGPGAALVHEALPHLTVDGPFDAAVSTFDGFNHLTLTELREALLALAPRIRPGGWLVFDAHTDAMMRFTEDHAVVEGEAQGHRFTITSVVDPYARTCDSRIVVERVDGGDSFTEHHRTHFFTEGQIRDALKSAGFGAIAITDEYAHRPVDRTTMRATWMARRTRAPGSAWS
ncbi:MAG: class I SAM-dependent methyltransferase [Thermoleophilia bacterium]